MKTFLVEKDDDMTLVQWTMCMHNYMNAAAVLKTTSISSAAIANHMAVVAQVSELCSKRGVYYKTAMLVSPSLSSLLVYLFRTCRHTTSRDGNTFVMLLKWLWLLLTLKQRLHVLMSHC
jgi:hypothetical protein